MLITVDGVRCASMPLIWTCPLLLFYTLPVLNPCCKWKNSVDVIPISLRNRDKAQHIRMNARWLFHPQKRKAL